MDKFKIVYKKEARELFIVPWLKEKLIQYVPIISIEKSNNKLFHYLVLRRSEINLSTDNNTVIGIHVKNRVFINSK